MVTIKTEIRTSGKSLMKNQFCEVVIKPSRGGKIRIFSKGSDVCFNADIDNLYSTDHCVTLCSKEHRNLLGDYKYKAMLCEHFMAACAICKIDSIDVYLSDTEFPIFDGKDWIDSTLNYLLYKQKKNPVFISFEKNIFTLLKFY